MTWKLCQKMMCSGESAVMGATWVSEPMAVRMRGPSTASTLATMPAAASKISGRCAASDWRSQSLPRAARYAQTPASGSAAVKSAVRSAIPVTPMMPATATAIYQRRGQRSRISHASRTGTDVPKWSGP